MRAVTVCVDYARILQRTIPLNLHHFEAWVIVTSPDDTETKRLIHAQNLGGNTKVQLVETDVFYRGGAEFNKGAAIEVGLDAAGREGWILCVDVDIILPSRMDLGSISPGNLYGARRRLMEESASIPKESLWYHFPSVEREHRPGYEIPGFFHLFHGSDAVFNGRPWYPTHWRHAGGYDTEFQSRWKSANRIWLPFYVLHVGDLGKNWCGVKEGSEARLRELMKIRSLTGRFDAEWVSGGSPDFLKRM